MGKIMKRSLSCLRIAGVVKRSNTTDCKSVGIRLRRFESYPQYQVKKPHRKVWLFYVSCSYIWSWGVVTSRLPALAREPSDEDGYAHNHDSCPYEEHSHGFDQKAEDASKKADE